VVFRLQFHTGAIQGHGLVFGKEDLDNANKGARLLWLVGCVCACACDDPLQDLFAKGFLAFFYPCF